MVQMRAKSSRRPRARSRRAGDALRLSREVLGHLPSGVVFFNAAGRVEEANPAARTALGLDRARGLTVARLFRDAELREPDGAVLGPAVPLVLDSYRNQRILQRKTMRYTTPAGQGRLLGVTLFPLRSAHDALPPVGLICLLTDLTRIHALEEELNRRQSLSALGEMAAGIAHEFRNGLAIISGYGQMLETALSEPARGQVHKIQEQAGMLNNIATEFLTFARPLPVQSEAVALEPLLRQCVEAIHVQDFPQVRIRLQGPFPEVLGDSVLLTSAFLNLLRNACEAILQGQRSGQVVIEYGGSSGDSVRVLFVDDGPGVAPEMAEKIFIPFFTTKPSGTGLGLAMVHKIITAHQGSVLLADAAPGHTVFEVLLPAAGSGLDPDDHGNHSAGGR
ncbi:MAG: two-component system sensor histidine kinase NtrB [Terriglobales bacterium]